MNRRTAPTCFTGWKQVTDDCPVCGPRGPCPEGLRPSSSLFRRFMCLIGKHRFYTIARLGAASRHVGCRDCDHQWGMNRDARAFLPWSEVADFHAEVHRYPPAEQSALNRGGEACDHEWVSGGEGAWPICNHCGERAPDDYGEPCYEDDQ